jgi:hypothetical protein
MPEHASKVSVDDELMFGRVSISNGGTNGSIKSVGNHVLANVNQSLGTGATAPFALACGTLATNSLYNAVQVNLAGGTGVTAIAKNGNTIVSQNSNPLSPFSMVLNVGETMRVTCTTVPTATYGCWTGRGPTHRILLALFNLGKSPESSGIPDRMPRLAAVGMRRSQATASQLCW